MNLVAVYHSFLLQKCLSLADLQVSEPANPLKTGTFVVKRSGRRQLNSFLTVLPSPKTKRVPHDGAPVMDSQNLSGFVSLDSFWVRFRISSGFPISDFGFRISDFGFPGFPISRFPISHVECSTDPQVPSWSSEFSGLRTSDFCGRKKLFSKKIKQAETSFP